MGRRRPQARRGGVSVGDVVAGPGSCLVLLSKMSSADFVKGVILIHGPLVSLRRLVDRPQVLLVSSSPLLSSRLGPLVLPTLSSRFAPPQYNQS